MFSVAGVWRFSVQGLPLQVLDNVGSHFGSQTPSNIYIKSNRFSDAISERKRRAPERVFFEGGCTMTGPRTQRDGTFQQKWPPRLYGKHILEYVIPALLGIFKKHSFLYDSVFGTERQRGRGSRTSSSEEVKQGLLDCLIFKI